MAEIIVFGGTAEGRLLCEWAASYGIRTLACTATAYGKELLVPAEGLRVRDGRLDGDGMRRLFLEEQPKAVVDATHPHASLVTASIRAALEGLPIRCLRVRREEGSVPPACPPERMHWVRTAAEAAELLMQDDRNILLTTGSKELPDFLSVPGLLPRVFARVLPTGAAISECRELGLPTAQIVAMQGPFSEGLNAELLKSVNAGWLVTKESGVRGGFPEKLKAAARCGADVIVIRRPQDAPGVSLGEAMRLLAEQFPPKKPGRITLIGMGMGGGLQLTQEALAALKDSDLVLGAKRMLADAASLISQAHTEPLYLGADILDFLEGHPQYRRIAVLYSGDTGFHSGAASLLAEIRKRSVRYQVSVCPGISTLSALCARFGLGWEEVFPASAHGTDCSIVPLFKEHERVFLLLDGVHTVSAVCRELTEAGFGGAFVRAGVRLGYADEELFSGAAAELTGRKTSAPAALIVSRDGASAEPGHTEARGRAETENRTAENQAETESGRAGCGTVQDGKNGGNREDSYER